jgi:DNA ligase-1
MTCSIKDDAKYLSRSSPPYGANECCGLEKIGNDGNLYFSKKFGNGVCRWVKVSGNKKSSKKSPKKSSKKSPKRKSAKKSSKKSPKRKSPKKSSRKSPKRRTQKKSNRKSPKRRTQKKSNRKSPKRRTQKKSNRKSPKKRTPKKSSKKSRPISSGTKTYGSKAISPMLAKPYDGKVDITGWYHSEKLDGVRGIWNKSDFYSRNQKKFNAPKSYKEYFPNDHMLDGELFTGRGDFKGAVSIVRKGTPIDSEWRRVKYKAFDLPSSKKPFEERMKELESVVRRSCKGDSNCPIEMVKQTKIRNLDHLKSLHKEVTAKGGEGSMIRAPGSFYESKRSKYLLKYKDIDEGDAIVVEHLKGNDKYSNMLGKLLVKWKSGPNKGIQFRVGNGFTDAERKNYKRDFPIGSTVNISYNGLTDSGKPRFPIYRGVHIDR